MISEQLFELSTRPIVTQLFDSLLSIVANVKPTANLYHNLQAN